MTRNVALYVALRLAGALLPLVPLRLAYALATLAGALAYRLLRGPRRAIEGNLAVVLGAAPSSREVQRAGQQAFAYDAMNWVDTLRIGRLSRQQVRDLIEVQGWEHLEGALLEHKGVILVTLHLGNFDFVGQIFAARGIRLIMPVEHMQPEKLFAMLAEQRASQGIRVVPVERAAWEMARALKAGDVVGIAGDRAVAGQTLAVEFFGRPAALPAGAVSLAARTGAPLLLAIGLRRPPHGTTLGPKAGYLGVISPPLSLTHARDATAENLRVLARAMEDVIRRYPEQWLVFTPVWKDYAPPSTPGTIEQPARVRA